MNVEHQHKPNWCWAAVATSIHNFLNASPKVTQEQLATAVLRKELQIGLTVDCTTNPGQCDMPAGLDDALGITGNLAKFFPTTFATFASIKTEIDAGHPLAARIAWFGGGAHFIVINGYR